MRALPGRLVLLGHPVAHSLSPRFQNAALQRAGVPLVYEAVDVAPADLRQRLTELRAIRAAGNVTIPHKEGFAALCDGLTPVARRAGAVNTFWIEGGRLIGDNTDVGGFDAVARDLLGRSGARQAMRVAMIGAGGAAAGVLCAVEQWSGARVHVFSRSPERTQRLCERFADLAEPASSAATAVAGAGLVVNATPIGLADDAMPIDPAILDAGTVVMDLVYRPGGTPWTRAASELGHRAIDGTDVLLEQGALAFQRWFGVPADRAAMREALLG